MTHAWLIIAHNEFKILQRLVSALDDSSNDIYVHIDRKCARIPDLYSEHSRIVMLDKRIDVRWGSISQIKCEMALFEAAAQGGSYDYYHVISGVTLPLKSLREIESFFQENKGKSIVSGLCQDTPYQEKLKLRRYNLFLKNYASRNTFSRELSQFLWKSAITAQRILGIETNRDKVFYKASNWLSLTDEALRYILARKDDILKTYRWSFCGDEFFIPSELKSSPLRDRVTDSDKYLHHEILRSTSTAYKIDELPALAASGRLFARKFTEA